MRTLTIEDLGPDAAPNRDDANIRSLSRAELREIRGGRSVGVLVDGTSTGTVDDFAINTAIFEGRISGPYLL